MNSLSDVNSLLFVDLEVTGTPRPQGSMTLMRAKHSNRTFGKYSDATTEHRNRVISLLTENWGLNPAPKHAPVMLQVDFFFARPKSHYGTGRNSEKLKKSAPGEHVQTPDLDKCVRLVSDALEISGVLSNDSQITCTIARKYWASEGTVSRTQILVHGYFEDEEQ